MTSVNEMNAVMQERARLREEVVKQLIKSNPRDIEVNPHIGTWEHGYNHALGDVLALLRE
jgi:hypothetical protein